MGFAIGSGGGALFHGIKGLKNAPRGMRAQSMMQQVALRAPVLGGLFNTAPFTAPTQHNAAMLAL